MRNVSEQVDAYSIHEFGASSHHNFSRRGGRSVEANCSGHEDLSIDDALGICIPEIWNPIEDWRLD